MIHIDTLLNEFNNLIIESFDLVNIKDEDTLTKISINRNLNIASIYLIDDIRYFKIDFSNGIKNALFYIDNVLVSKDIFKNELINVKSHELNL